MGIVVHDQNEVILELSVPGTQTIADNLDVKVIPFNGWVRAVLARLDTAGVTGSQTTDILLNGSSMVGSGTLMSFADGSRVPTYTTPSTNPPVVVKGDTLRLNTTAIHSGTAAKSLSVLVTIRRGRASSQGFDADSVSFISDAI